MLGAQPRLPGYTPVTVTADDPISPLPPPPEPGVIDVEITGGMRMRVTGAPPLGRKAWLFAGSDRGGEHDLPQTRPHELFPWNWKVLRVMVAAAA